MGREINAIKNHSNGGKAKKDRSNVCQHYYPILAWNNQDVADFLLHYNVDINPHYLDEDGIFDPNIRLGCMCCPVKSQGKQLAEFRENPKFVRLWIRAGLEWWDKPRKKEISSKAKFGTIYDLFFHNLFCNSYEDYKYKVWFHSLFGKMDCKKFLEDYFNVKLD